MNIADSSCWIEYLTGSEIGAAVAPLIENPAELIIPVITIYEVYKKLTAEKGEQYANQVASYMQTGTVIEMTAELSISAARISRTYKLPMADSIIYATSLASRSTIWTCDRHFKDIPDIQYFPKT
jgi:predicted nucleic acid-binding protein